MSVFQNYHYEQQPKLKGKHWVEILDVKQDVSKTTGRDMLVVTVRPNTRNFTIKDYFVNGTPSFNGRLSSFYDSFDIPAGDEETLTWRGAIGVAFLREDDRGFTKVGSYISRAEVEKSKDIPAWEGPVPERATISSLPTRSDAADPNDDGNDELPF